MRKQLKDRVMETLVDTLEEKVHLARGANTVYSDASLFITLIWAGINKISIEEAAEQLRELEYHVPSGDTVLYHLSNQPYQQLEHGFQEVFDTLLEQATPLFDGPVTVAIDFNLLEWYGEELPFIIKSQPRKGTDTFIGFATIAVVEDGKRFTLRAVPVTPFSEKTEIVRELLEYALRFVEIKVVLMDRGFYSGAVIALLNDWVPFIMPAVNNQKVQRYKERAVETGEIDYTMSDGTSYRMVVWMENDTIHPFATNTTYTPESIRRLYKHRFGIETQYRIKNKFLGRTCSKEYSVRYFFFILAICIYNLWVLFNVIERGVKGLNPGKIPIKVDRIIYLVRKVIFFNAPSR